jgi:hypothetical protein
MVGKSYFLSAVVWNCACSLVVHLVVKSRADVSCASVSRCFGDTFSPTKFKEETKKHWGKFAPVLRVFSVPVTLKGPFYTVVFFSEIIWIQRNSAGFSGEIQLNSAEF